MGLYLPNPNFSKDIMGSEDYNAALAETADRVRPIAESNAQRIRPYQSEAMEVQSDEEGVRLVNTDYGAIIDEFGSIRNPPNASLRRAVTTAGLRLAEEPRT